MTQRDRLILYLRANPGVSSLEITLAMSLVNVTGRISDIRKLPEYDVLCKKRRDGADGYWLVEHQPVTTGEPIELGLSA